jgi:hypothetical protein
MKSKRSILFVTIASVLSGLFWKLYAHDSGLSVSSNGEFLYKDEFLLQFQILLAVIPSIPVAAFLVWVFTPIRRPSQAVRDMLLRLKP